MLKSPPLNPSPNPNPLEREGERRRLPASFRIAGTSIDSESGRSMYKNQLQEFTQKSAIALPVYETVNIGEAHAEFRSTVLVDGLKFTSSSTFSNRKAAEQHVAKLALESISRKIESEGVSWIQEDTTFCKSIIHEYAVKICVEKLTNQKGLITYTTCRSEAVLPVFSSSIVFNGQTYTGHPAKSKKEAEQMAARAVIESILAQSDKRALMCEIIRSKRKLYAAISAAGNSSSLSSEEAPLRSQNNPIEAIATGTLTLEAKTLKEEYTCEMSFGDEGNSHSQQTVPPEGSPHVVLTSGMKRSDDPTNEESDSKKARTC